jgi:hypothetical protein
MTLHYWIINPRRFEVTHCVPFDGPEVKTVSSFETSGSYYLLTQRRIPKNKILSRFALETSKLTFLSLLHFARRFFHTALVCLLGESEIEGETLKQL